MIVIPEDCPSTSSHPPLLLSSPNPPSEPAKPKEGTGSKRKRGVDYEDNHEKLINSSERKAAAMEKLNPEVP
ncbi:hypothetical protein J437_LFUL013873 [Ladona fulva]|uniref:Uncharacterized protein n=1 Tax=Ladona fulva TaxID=123851 RepID=A0A8K0P7J8_LADFU|nr:hypothetical protein J437_LFUL013873 [Ladona fulva]